MRHDKYEYHRFSGHDHTAPYYSSERRIQAKPQQLPTWVIASAILILAVLIYGW